VRVGVGAKDVRQHQGIAGVGLLLRDPVPVTVARRGERIDRVNLPGARAQGGDEQALAGFDRHRDRVLGRVPVVGEQFHQVPVACGVVGDPAFGPQHAGAVDDGNVMVALGPVDPAVKVQSVLLTVKACSVPGVCQFGSRSALIPRLEGLPSHQPFVKRVHFGRPGLTKSSTAPGEGRGHPAACTPPREPSTTPTVGGSAATRVGGTWPAKPEHLPASAGSCGVNLHRYAPLFVEGSRTQERRRRRSSAAPRNPENSSRPAN
jgi:hypothetical protein